MVRRTDRIVQNVKAFLVLTFKLTISIVVLVQMLALTSKVACRVCALALLLHRILVTEDGESIRLKYLEC